jgi:hypothetical protein
MNKVERFTQTNSDMDSRKFEKWRRGAICRAARPAMQTETLKPLTGSDRTLVYGESES